MSYIRTKNINNNLYYYEVASVRIGKKVQQKHVRYIGKSLADVSRLSGYLDDNRLNKINLRSVPNNKPGVYYLYNRKKKLIYIGRAGDNHGFGLRHRISAHYQNDNSRPEWVQKLSRNATYFLYMSTKTDQLARDLEKEEISKYKPRYNNYQKKDTVDSKKQQHL